MNKVISRVHPVHLMNVDWAPGGCQVPTLRPSHGLGLWVRRKLAAIIHIHHRHCYYYWYSFYRPTEGGRLSRPRQCSKGAQPVSKAVYRSRCRDKHKRPQCDSNLGPLKPQSDALTTRLLRPVQTERGVRSWERRRTQSARGCVVAADGHVQTQAQELPVPASRATAAVSRSSVYRESAMHRHAVMHSRCYWSSYTFGRLWRSVRQSVCLFVCLNKR